MTSYEVVYFSTAGRADIIRMMLYVAQANYKNTFITPTEWPEHKADHRYGHVPALVIRSDGTSKTLWESSAIESYLAEVLGFLPVSSPFARAECLAHRASLSELTTGFLSGASDVEGRRALIEKHRTETIPNHLAYHERAVVGKFYCGEKPTLPDFALYQIYILAQEIYGEKSPLTEERFPNLIAIVHALAGGKAGDYVSGNRTFPGQLQMVWDHEQCKYNRVIKEITTDL